MSTVVSVPRRIARNAQRGLTLLEIMIVIAILGILIAVIAPRVIGALSESKHELTKVRVHKIANEYYARWSIKSTDKPCPDSLIEVGRAVDPTMKEEEVKDLWGQNMKFMCGDALPAGAKGLAVYSFGENQKDENGAGDDIKSW
jgi:general secretion pathway protein G